MGQRQTHSKTVGYFTGNDHETPPDRDAQDAAETLLTGHALHSLEHID